MKINLHTIAKRISSSKEMKKKKKNWKLKKGNGKTKQNKKKTRLLQLSGHQTSIGRPEDV